jgi:hypothetical protein
VTKIKNKHEKKKNNPTGHCIQRFGITTPRRENPHPDIGLHSHYS